MASGKDPRELVAFLNRVFSVIDGLVEKHGLEKIKTIGDAYMVAAGVPDPRPDHIQAVADFALELLEALREVTDEAGQPVQLRLGMHSGPVVAGVIGEKKFAYDLWGDTVNIASRMERTGEPGRIHLTASTKELLGPGYRFEGCGAIEVKGKGEMDTCFLVGKDA